MLRPLCMSAMLAGGRGKIVRRPVALALLLLQTPSLALPDEIPHIGHGNSTQQQQRHHAYENPMIHCASSR